MDCDIPVPPKEEVLYRSSEDQANDPKAVFSSFSISYRKLSEIWKNINVQFSKQF